MTESLWDLTFNKISEKSTENLISIIREQTVTLKNDTNGKIKAKFGEIKDVSIGSTVGRLALSLKKEIVEGEDTASLKNGNADFKDKRYGFEIFNEEYKFRIFEISISLEYPVVIILDEGVADYMDIGSNEINIESDEHLKQVLKEIFTSKKVKSILAKLLTD